MEIIKRMQANGFDQFPDESRIWIHGFGDPLSAEDQELVRETLSAFHPNWLSHGSPVQAASEFYEDRFVITAAHCSTGISGCSTDSFVRNFKELRQRGVDGLNGALVFYRDRDGIIHSAEHLDFFRLCEDGTIRPSTPVFDTLLHRLSDFRRGRFELPFQDSWHSRTYPLSQVRA